MHDSGKEEQFATGAVRDSAVDKPLPHLVSPWAMERLGNWLRLGAERRPKRNWEQGIPLDRTTASLYRHLVQWQQQDESEDHLAAIMCNAMFLIHTQEMIKRGALPGELDDMPRYLPSPTVKKTCDESKRSQKSTASFRDRSRMSSDQLDELIEKIRRS